jgi:hypothetical protein
MHSLDVFSIILIGLFFCSLFVFAQRFFCLKKSNKTKSQIKKIIQAPIFILMGIVFLLGFKTMSDLETITIMTEKSKTQIMLNKWELIEEYLNLAMLDSFDLAQNLSFEIIDEVTDTIDSNKIDYYLDNIGIINNNPIQTIIGDKLQGVYFRNVISDANDPFAILIGKDDKDSFLFADFSENCAVEELTRNLELEYELQGRNGDKELAKVAFNKLVNLRSGYPLANVIFFQFESKEGVKLRSYDLTGLKESFFENDGDFEKTFKSIEFLAPFYIYRNNSLGGSPRIVNRQKTDAKIIGIVSVFSLYDIILYDNYFNNIIKQKDRSIEMLITNKIDKERFFLMTGILVTMLTTVMFILFWIFLHSYYKTDD